MKGIKSKIKDINPLDEAINETEEQEIISNVHQSSKIETEEMVVTEPSIVDDPGDMPEKHHIKHDSLQDETPFTKNLENSLDPDQMDTLSQPEGAIPRTENYEAIEDVTENFIEEVPFTTIMDELVVEATERYLKDVEAEAVTENQLVEEITEHFLEDPTRMNDKTIVKNPTDQVF